MDTLGTILIELRALKTHLHVFFNFLPPMNRDRLSLGADTTYFTSVNRRHARTTRSSKVDMFERHVSQKWLLVCNLCLSQIHGGQALKKT